MRIVAARRAATEAALGPKADWPKPRTKLRARSPRLPRCQSDCSERWAREAQLLERPQLTRLLGDLKDRLKRERARTEALEAKLPPVSGPEHVASVSTMSSETMKDR